MKKGDRAMNVLRRLRLALMLIAFVGGQLLMLAHAAENHDGGEEAPHVCLLCIAGQDLQGAVPPPASSAPATSTASVGAILQIATAELPHAFIIRCPARAPPRS